MHGPIFVKNCSKFFLVINGLLFDLFSLIFNFINGKFIVIVLSIFIIFVMFARNVCFGFILVISDSRNRSHTDVLINEIFSSEIKIYESIIWLNLLSFSGNLQLGKLSNSNAFHGGEHLDHVVWLSLKDWIIC